MEPNTWEQVQHVRQWLDDNTEQRGEEDRRLLRVLKISEELGEVSEAVHGALSANPRKGASHTWDDVRMELCDVLVTSMVALATLTDDPAKELDARLERLVGRLAPGQ